MSAYTLLYISCCRTLSYPTRTRPEFRSGTGSGGIWAGTCSGRYDRYQTGTTIFFMLDYRFSLFLQMSYLHHVLPSSSLAESSAFLQFPDCITCYTPVPRLFHDITCSPPVPRLYHDITCSPPVPRLYHDITCSPPVTRLYNELPSSSQTVSRAPLQFPEKISDVLCKN